MDDILTATPEGDERLTAFQIDKKGLLLGLNGETLLDYSYIIKVLKKKFKSYAVVKVKSSPHRGAHTILKSELDEYNRNIIQNLAKEEAELQAIRDNFNEYAKR